MKYAVGKTAVLSRTNAQSRSCISSSFYDILMDIISCRTVFILEFFSYWKSKFLGIEYDILKILLNIILQVHVQCIKFMDLEVVLFNGMKCNG